MTKQEMQGLLAKRRRRHVDTPSFRRKAKIRSARRQAVPGASIATNFNPSHGAMDVIAKQRGLQHIDITRMGPPPNYEKEDHPDGYARYPGKVSANVLMSIAACVPEMRSVSLKGSKTVSRVVLRSLSCSAAGESLTAIDLSDSSLDNDAIQVLAHFEGLRNIDLAGTLITDAAIQWIIEGSFHSLRQLKLANCKNISDVTCEWIAGLCGFKPKPCRLLMSLDLGHCSRIGDGSLAALAHGCPRLEYLNLELCARVSDRGIASLTSGCHSLKVLLLRRVSKISNYSLACIGAHCHRLRSICLDFCINVGDSGIEKLASGCPRIECISLAGCLRLSERTVCAIAGNCPNLMALNVTGCQGVTENGLANLCRGNGFLEPAKSFQGLKPRRECERMKIRDMERRIIEAAASKIQNGLYRAWKGRERFRAEWHRLKVIPSTLFLQRSWRRRAWRVAIGNFLDQGIERRKRTIQIQRWYRMRMAPAWERRRAVELERDRKNNLIVAKIQATFRGRNARRRYPCREVPDYFEMKRLRLIHERRHKAACLLQRIWHGKMCRKRFLARSEEASQRRRDIEWGSLTIECAWRCMVARMRLTELREAWAAKMAVEIAAATFCQRVFRGWCGRREAQRRRHVREVIYQLKIATATKLQGALRGWLVRKSEILGLSEKIQAATKIQALYRCHATPGIAVFATNMAQKQISYNAALEARDREVDAAKTKEDYRASLLKDSASEDEEAEEWTQFWNEEKDVPFWYSELKDPPEKGGSVRRQTTFHDPYGRDFELNMIGNRCKVRWPRGLDERARFDEWGNRLRPRYPLKDGDVERWYEGVILSYHVDKDKHRVYFTGSMAKNRPPDIVYSREWICMREYPHRIQIEVEAEDGSGEKSFVLYHTLSAELRRARKALIQRMRWERAGGASGPGHNTAVENEESPEEDQGYLAGGEDGANEGNPESMVANPEVAEHEGSDESQWEMFVDEETGASYWYSHQTGDSVWATD